MSHSLKRIILLLFFMIMNTTLLSYFIGLVMVNGDPGTTTLALIEYFKSLVTIAFFVFILGAIAIKWSSHAWFKTLHQIHHLIESLVLHHFKLSPQQKLTVESLASHSQPEIAQLGHNFQSMISDIERGITQENQVAHSKELFDSELAIGRQIQMSLLPPLDYLLKDQTKFDIYAALRQSKEVGGDGYDCFLLGPDHLLCFIGDVSGKGIPAAVFMTVAKTFVRGYAEIGVSPGKILGEVNREICRNNEASMFVSVFLGIIDLKTGLVEFSSAGHTPPYIISKQMGVKQFEIPSHPAIGILEGYQFETRRVQLQKEDKLFLYTNIANEIHDAQEVLYTYAQMEEVLDRLRSCSVTQVVNGLLEAIDNFAPNVEQSDDLTLLCMEFKGGE